MNAKLQTPACLESRVTRTSKGSSVSRTQKTADVMEAICILQSDYAQWKLGIHAARYELLQRTYVIIGQFERSKSQFDALKQDHFWSSSRQKPKENNIAKWVTYYVLEATTKRVRDRAQKYARVLDWYRRLGVKDDGVVHQLEKDEGIEKALKRAKDADQPKMEAATVQKPPASQDGVPTDRKKKSHGSQDAGRTGKGQKADSQMLEVELTDRLLKRALSPGKIKIIAKVEPSDDWHRVVATKVTVID